MQTSDKLNINPQAGKGFGQISTEWFKYVNNVLRFLQIRNGRLIVNDDKWTIECGGGAGLDVAGEQEQYKVITLIDVAGTLTPTWDWYRLP